MKILSLDLENFQGIKAEHFDFNGENASIYGDNGTGKTTVYNAFTYLLTGNASTGAKNYTPKTAGSHNLDHTATAIIEIDGQAVEFKKTFHEVYTQKRGTTTKEFKGHETLYFIDGVPTKEKDYSAKIAATFGDADQVKALTMPFYFPEAMKWEDRRKILLNICGNVTDQEVIASNPELAPLPAILENRTADDYKKVLAARRKELNRQIDDIPVRIDEASKAIPQDFHENSLEELEVQMQQLKEEGNKAWGRLEALKHSDGQAEVAAEINKLEIKLDGLKRSYKEKYTQELYNWQQQQDDLQQQISKRELEKTQSGYRIKDLETNIEQMTKERERYATIWQEAHDRTWNEDQETCPTCGQALPAEKIDTLKAEFNLKKAEDMEEARARARGSQVSKDKIAEQEAKLAEEKENLADIETEIARLQAWKADLPKPIEEIAEDTEEYKALQQQIADLKNQDAAPATNEEAIQNEANHIKDIDQRRTETEQKMQAIKMAESLQDRIAELEQEQKNLAAAFEQTEYELNLCELFTKTKVQMLDDKINSKFEAVRFRLFQEQINGGIKDDCEVLIPCQDKLVPFTFANNAARINAGLEIIHTLSEAWGRSIPVWIDNAESVTKLKEYPDSQTIRLVVSEEDKKLNLKKEI